MRILFVTPFLPSPPRFGAERRLDALARGLARKHAVSLLWFNADDAAIPVQLAQRHPYCERVSTTRAGRGSSAQRRWLQLRSLASTHSFEYLRAARRSDFQTVFDELLSSGHYDVVQFESAEVASFAFDKSGSGRPVFVLDEHNVEYDLARRAGRASRSLLRRAYGAVNWRKLAREERAAWRRCDGVTLTSRRDQALLEADVAECKSALIPNGVDLETFPVATTLGAPDTLLFFGALNYFPNQDGLLEFIDGVWPLIKQRRPHATLLVVGPGAPDSIRKRAGGGIEIVGEVADVGSYLERARAVVVPVRIGGGTRLKIIEAMAKGRPVISTTVGAEGLHAKDDRQLLLADRPEDFAREVVRVLEDPELAARLGSAGRKHVEEHFDWRPIVLELERFYDQLASSRLIRD